MQSNRDKVIKQFVIYLLVLISAIIIFSPIFWMISVSLRRNVEVFTAPPRILPNNLYFGAYAAILSNKIYLRYFFNSYFISASVTFVCIIVASLAAYGFSRYKYKANNYLLVFLILAQMFPPVLLVIPYFMFTIQLNFYDTYWALILTYISVLLPFSTLMLKSYFDTIPRSLEEAAMIDGCSRLQTIRMIVFPLSVPGIIATAVYSFLQAWNEYLLAVTLTERWEYRTVTAGVGFLVGEFTSEWNQMMALSVLGSLPLLIVFLFAQKYMMKGLTLGSVKG